MIHDVSETIDAWDAVLHENVKGFPESIMSENIGSLCFALNNFLLKSLFNVVFDHHK